MDRKSFGGMRWTIIYGRYDGVEGYAVDEIYKAVQQYVPYILSVNDDRTDLKDVMDHNMVFIGTESSNRHIKGFIEKGIIKPNTAKEGYVYKVCTNPLNNERKAIIIAGADESGVLYGVRDFEHYYLNRQWYKEGYRFKPDVMMMTEEMPDAEAKSAPALENRGIWTWGHVIYDYKKFLDNMSKWKMNIAIIWNDHAPLNGKQIVEYAHSRGIKVIWGYTWCWGEDVDPTDEEDIRKWTQKVIDIYEGQYEGLGGDGIYFQTFTEIPETKIKDMSVTKLVTGWVNRIAGRLLERHPDLWIQFGLHATSIKDDYKDLVIDPRISIVWEDAGSFPYKYDAADIEGAGDTLAYTSRISGLRGKEEDFGLVVKGCTTLDWLAFEHQKGVFILGEAKDDFIKKRAAEKAPIWRYVQSQWQKNLGYVTDTLSTISKKDIKRKTATVLIEDGMWEEHMYCPGALFAEAAWDPEMEPGEIIRNVSLTNDVYFI